MKTSNTPMPTSQDLSLGPDITGLSDSPGIKFRLKAVVKNLLYGGDVEYQPDQLHWLGIGIDNTTRDGAIETITSVNSSERCRTVNFANPHCLNIAYRNAPYAMALSKSDLVLPDGSGLKIAGRILKEGVKENLNGTDLFPLICGAARDSGLSIYLLGAQPGVAEQVAEKMQSRLPGLKVAGVRDGFFQPDKNDEVIDEINASGADLLFVAMGVPMQELWIEKAAGQLDVRTALGVGGLFDFYSERISRAPTWLREIGMEWTWRLLQEPRRMWRRYIIGNPLFLYRIYKQSRARKLDRRFSPLRLRLRRLTVRLSRVNWRMTYALSALVKRSMDIVATGLALVAVSPLLALVALLIRLESPGSVFFSQIRVGRYGKPFRIWKFRSMYIDAEDRKQALLVQNEMDGGVIFKMKNDPRITRVGRVIRRLSIDELPQLWNVLIGDMSLVGPRPPLPGEVAQYSAHERQRLSGAPGITCIWQVSGRSEIPFEQQVEMDIDYLHSSTVKKNISLLLKTVPAVLSGRGAY